MNVEFLDKLQPLFEPHRYKVLVGGRDALKSWSIARALLLLASQKPLRILCCREIQNSLKESVHKLLTDQIDNLGLGEHFEILEHEIRGRFTGSHFFYTGLEKQTKESMKSYEGIDIAWIEEAANVSKQSLNILEPTLRKAGSEIWISFNPNLDTDEVYVRFVTHPPPEAVVIHMNWRDNKWTTPESELVRRIMQEQSAEEYDHIYEGKPRSAVVGSVYAREVTELITSGRYAPCPYDPRLKVHTVWDLGWSGSCTIHLVQSDLSAIRIIGYLEGRHLRIDEWGALLKSMPLNWGWDWLPHDGYHTRGQSGLSDAAALRAMGRKVRGQHDSVPGPFVINEESGIRTLRNIFRKIYVHHGDGLALFPSALRANPRGTYLGLTHWTTARLVECWKRFRYTIPAHGEPSTPVKDEYKHACDGTRYLALVAHLLSNEDESSEQDRPIDLGQQHDYAMGTLG